MTPLMHPIMHHDCTHSCGLQRKIFGKRLIDQPVIRYKLAQMAAEVEVVHSMLEVSYARGSVPAPRDSCMLQDVTYQMKESIRIHGDESEMNKRLAGPIALLKVAPSQPVAASLISIIGCSTSKPGWPSCAPTMPARS